MGEKLQVYDEVQVECTAPWLEAPHALILPHNGRNFEVQVTVSEASSGLGQLHTASVIFMAHRHASAYAHNVFCIAVASYLS